MSSLDDIFAKKRKAPASATPSTAAKKKRLIEKPTKAIKVAKSGPVVVEKEIDQEASDAQEVFRRHFEAQFKPLPPVSAKKDKKFKRSTVVEVVEEELSDEEDSDDGLGDFDGLSEDSGSSDDEIGGMDDDSQLDDDSDEEDGVMATPGTVGKSQAPVTVVEVVEHDKEIERPRMTKAEMKAFMSSKPPTDPSSIIPPDALKLGDPDEAGEQDNLKNDLALQRLLAESHLIESGAESLNHTGKAHHKATDLRLQALGAKGSVFTQKSMPLFMRKGMLKKSTEKEEKRRTEARENGIILERIKGGKASGKERRPQDRRERGVGAPAVGRFEGGTLKISKRDVYEIEGPKKREGKGGRGGRGGGRGGRGGKRGGRGK